MPASMMIAVVAGWPKVIGSSREMVATGPMPGSTPMAVPISAPISAKITFWKLSATPNPNARLLMMSIIRRSLCLAPWLELRPDGHADVELLDEDPPAQREQEDRDAEHAERPLPVLGFCQAGDDDGGEQRQQQPALLQQQAEDAEPGADIADQSPAFRPADHQEADQHAEPEAAVAGLEEGADMRRRQEGAVAGDDGEGERGAVDAGPPLQRVGPVEEGGAQDDDAEAHQDPEHQHRHVARTHPPGRAEGMILVEPQGDGGKQDDDDAGGDVLRVQFHAATFLG